MCNVAVTEPELSRREGPDCPRSSVEVCERCARECEQTVPSRCLEGEHAGEIAWVCGRCRGEDVRAEEADQGATERYRDAWDAHNERHSARRERQSLLHGG